MLLSLLFTRDDDDQQEFYRKSYLLSFTLPNRGSLSQARPVTCDDLCVAADKKTRCRCQMSDRVTASSPHIRLAAPDCHQAMCRLAIVCRIS